VSGTLNGRVLTFSNGLNKDVRYVVRNNTAKSLNLYEPIASSIMPGDNAGILPEIIHTVMQGVSGNSNGYGADKTQTQTHTPHKLVISKDGYETQTISFTSKIENNYVVKLSQSFYGGRDNMGDEFQ
jgi:hypothetical protein